LQGERVEDGQEVPEYDDSIPPWLQRAGVDLFHDEWMQALDQWVVVMHDVLSTAENFVVVPVDWEGCDDETGAAFVEESQAEDLVLGEKSFIVVDYDRLGASAVARRIWEEVVPSQLSDRACNLGDRMELERQQRIGRLLAEDGRYMWVRRAAYRDPEGDMFIGICLVPHGSGRVSRCAWEGNPGGAMGLRLGWCDLAKRRR
jgi:hypothetical protein